MKQLFDALERTGAVYPDDPMLQARIERMRDNQGLCLCGRMKTPAIKQKQLNKIAVNFSSIMHLPIVIEPGTVVTVEALGEVTAENTDQQCNLCVKWSPGRTVTLCRLDVEQDKTAQLLEALQDAGKRMATAFAMPASMVQGIIEGVNSSFSEAKAMERTAHRLTNGLRRVKRKPNPRYQTPEQMKSATKKRKRQKM